MAKILLILSIVVTLLTAGLGFMTKNKVDGLKSTLTATQTEKQSAQMAVTKLTGDLKKKGDDLLAAQKTNEDQKTQITGLTADLGAAKSDAEKAKTEATEATAKLAEKEKELTDYAAAHPPTNGEKPVGPAPEPAQEVAALKTQLEEQKTVIETLKTREKESLDKVTVLNNEVQRYKAPIGRLGTTGHVVAVNPGWNFVVIDVGDKRGASVNSPLLVMRGGQPVARLKITSVEPGSSIADVVPGSMARGQTVQPGDQIVFAGRTSATLPPPATSGSGTGNGTTALGSPSLPTQ